MAGLHDFSIDFLTAHPLAVWLGLAALMVLAVFIYRRTNPPLPLAWRVLLGCLRVIAVVAVVAALAEPVVSYALRNDRPKRLAVLVDRSLSMAKPEGGRSRGERVDSLLATSAWDQVQRQCDVVYRYFGGNLTDAADQVDASKTALGDVLHDLSPLAAERGFDYCLLLTDGRSNSGRDPRETVAGLHTPVIAVNVASGQEQFDMGIAEVNYNPVVFSGQRTQLKLTFHWQGIGRQPAIVQLRDNDGVLDSDTVPLTLEDGRADVELSYVPQAPGQKVLRLQLVPHEGEETTDNNGQTISQKILKSRLSVLMLAEHPDYEVGFLKRFLDQSDRYDVDFRMTGSKAGNQSGRFPENVADLNRFDLVILYDPSPSRLSPYQETIRSYLADRGGALWVMMGPAYAADAGAQWLTRLLPFFSNRRVPVEQIQFRAEPVDAQLNHPVLRLADEPGAIRTAWSEVPPFASLVPCDQVAPEGVILAWMSHPGSPDSQTPVIGYRRIGAGKVFATAAAPFWTWGFTTLGVGGSNQYYTRFLDGVLSWLTVSEDFDPIRVGPVRDVFTRGEEVRFRGYAYDIGFRPLTGVSGRVRLLDEGGQVIMEADLNPVGEGALEASISAVPPGTHRYEAVLEKDNQPLIRREGSVVVESFSLEEFDRRPDPAVLNAIAQQSGGRYLVLDQWESGLAGLDLSPVVLDSRSEIPLAGKPWLLVVVIGALATEWMLRKLQQLV